MSDANILTQVAALQGALKGLPKGQLKSAGLAALRDLGLVRSESDLVGLSNVMRDFPGPYPRGQVNDQQIGSFFQHIQDLSLAPLRAEWEQPAGANLPGRGREGAVFFTLARETAAANAAARTTDSFSIEVPFPVEDAILWMNTAQGVVDEITELKVDGVEMFLGVVDFFDTLVMDLETNAHPFRTGLYVGDITETISMNVGLRPFSQDIVWKVHCEGIPKRGAGNRRNLLALSPYLRG